MVKYSSSNPKLGILHEWCCKAGSSLNFDPQDPQDQEDTTSTMSTQHKAWCQGELNLSLGVGGAAAYSKSNRPDTLVVVWTGCVPSVPVATMVAPPILLSEMNERAYPLTCSGGRGSEVGMERAEIDRP